MPGEEAELFITFLAPMDSGIFDATLTIFTDEDAELGHLGKEFLFQLSASARVPEPSGLALLATAAGAVLALRRRRR